MGIIKKQFGFLQSMETLVALITFNVLIQRWLEVNQNVYACFMDYKIVFDIVLHDQLNNALISKHLEYRALRIISKLY